MGVDISVLCVCHTRSRFSVCDLTVKYDWAIMAAIVQELESTHGGSMCFGGGYMCVGVRRHAGGSK